MAGPGPGFQVIVSAAFGWCVGRARVTGGGGRLRTLSYSLPLVWVPASFVVDSLLAVLRDTRRLTLEQVTIGWQGARHVMEALGLDALTGTGDRVVRFIVERWWASIPLGLLGACVLFTLLTRVIARPALTRLEESLGPADDAVAPADPGPAGPLPAVLEHVSFRYPGATADALHGITLTIEPGALVAVIGPNGSGKSTLARLLAGRPPTTGRITRPGAPAPGREGGTAVVAQRPESQVLGVRVADDVVWGLPARHHIDVAGVLASVGLAGFEERETSTLSGGELQRLAVAAALARRPALLVSDESTTMLDAGGRDDVTALLRGLARGGLTVVHVTHRLAEAEAADTVIALDGGRVVAMGPPSAVLRSLV